MNDASTQPEPIIGRTCGCNVGLMAALSPMHPHHYLNAACDDHRRRMVEANPMVWGDYEPEDWRNLGR